MSNLLHDERFSRMFTDADYQVDVLSDEYRLLNPVISKMEKRLEDKPDDDLVWIHVTSPVQIVSIFCPLPFCSYWLLLQFVLAECSGHFVVISSHCCNLMMSLITESISVISCYIHSNFFLKVAHVAFDLYTSDIFVNGNWNWKRDNFVNGNENGNGND